IESAGAAGQPHPGCVNTMRLLIKRFVSSLSVRSRIIFIVLLPVVGFVANGLNFMSGERDVGAAFQAAQHAGALADASRDFKMAISDMRIGAKDFASAPSDELVQRFAQGQQAALNSLAILEGLIDPQHAATIAGMRGEIIKLRKNFDELVSEQKRLG